jgi:hypothetical protein
VRVAAEEMSGGVQYMVLGTNGVYESYRGLTASRHFRFGQDFCQITPRLCISADPASGSRIYKPVLLSHREEGVMEEVEAKSEESGRRGSEKCQWLRQVWNK